MSEDLTHHVSDLLPEYVLGSLDPAERQWVETHLAGCSACQVEAAALRETVGELALAVPAADPPADLRERLQKRIIRTNVAEAEDADPPVVVPVAPEKRSWWERWRPATGRPIWQAALVTLIIALVVSNFLWWQTLSRVQAPPVPGEMMAIELSPTGEAPAAAGFLMVSADGLSGAIVIDDVPILGEEEQYQLWLIREGERDSAALFSVDELGYGGSRVDAPRSLFDYNGLEITVEPAEGSHSPTGSTVLVGTLFTD